MAYHNGPQDFPVAGARFGVALSWDHAGGREIDVDLQAIAFDGSGKLLDAVYYNNLKACGKGLTHSGDETTGAKSGFDEVVWAQLQRMPESVRLVVYVVACHSGGHLRDVRNGKFHLLGDTPDTRLGEFRLEESEEEVDCIGALFRGADGAWSFKLVDLPAQDGRHFMDILEPTIGTLVRQLLPGAPRRIKACFAMEKGSVVDLPLTQEAARVKACLGWDTSCGNVDLDVSAVMLDANCRPVDTVFFGNLEGRGVVHSGDNLTGEGDGDDEVISVDFGAIATNVAQVVFVINIYTNGRSFAQVANPYCRVIFESGEEVCRYALREAGNKQGLIIARLMREPGDRWGVQAMGLPCIGKTWKDSMPEITRSAAMKPTALQLARTSTFSSHDPAGFAFGGGPSAPAASRPSGASDASAPFRAAPPPQRKQKEKDCSVQ
eukprot:TRINITY_DN24277_c1_g1_i1.p1 TRINITY_DN24277_c1_g1~~TRINITY_DN24277_c1_g1_i1.p1  ORF type:complete len:435 (-),score=108.43 TRINITY_DN24277_c1_g1_i1:32-1336(-)